MIRHTSCRPGGTFQLSVATDAAAEGRRGVVDPERRFSPSLQLKLKTISMAGSEH